MRIATSLIEHRAGEAATSSSRSRPTDTLDDRSRRARQRRGTTSSASSRSRARRDGPAHDAVLEPLPAVPVSELGARERRHRGRARVAARGAVLDRLAAEPRRPRPAATSSTARCTSTTASGTPTGPSGRATRCSTPARRRAGRRLRPAVPRRRLDRALVVAGLREPDDRHELGRRVRRRLREGRQGLRRAATPTTPRSGTRPWRRRATTRTTRASAARAWRRRCSSATRPVASRGRLVGARGLHQRLRHRQHGRRRSPAEPTRCRQASATARSPSTSSAAPPTTSTCSTRAIGFFQGRHASGAGSPRRTSTTRASGATSTTTPRPTAGTSRSTCRRTARGSRTSTAAGTRSRASSTRSSRRRRPAKFTGSYGGTIHEMIEARDVRMGQWGFSQPGVAPHPVHVRRTPGSRGRRRRRCARRCAASTPAPRSARATPATRTTARRRRGTCSPRSGFYPLQMGSPNYAIGSPLFKKRDDPPGAGRDIVVSAPNNSTRNVYVQGLRVNGRRWNKTYLPHSMLANGATLDVRHGPAAVAAGRPARRRRAAVDDRRGASRAAAARRHRQARRRGDARPATTCRAVRRQLGHRGVDRRRGSQYAVRRGGVPRASTR